jgi:hypothetical protein
MRNIKRRNEDTGDSSSEEFGSGGKEVARKITGLSWRRSLHMLKIPQERAAEEEG